MKESLDLDRVVLLGRTLEEYSHYFGLNAAALRGQTVLDIASGVSSFCAEANATGVVTTAFDLIYDLSPEQIRSRCGPDLDFIVKEIGRVKAYRWDFYKSPEGMRAFRERAYKKFLADYEQFGAARYVAGKLPHLPFATGQFDLSLASYLLFVYEDQKPFDYDFHKKSLLEIMRVTRGEARIYPLVNFKAGRCSFVDRVKADPELKQFHFQEIKTHFEFLANSNFYLRITRQP
jgi:SAM-dependent methyltransferase